MRRVKINLEHCGAEVAAAGKVAMTLSRAGFQAGIVGGAVRDLLLGKRPSDADLVTTAHPQVLAALFPDAKLVGASFGVSLVSFEDVSLEVATAREERCYLDGRHPESVKYTDSLESDMLRRDFTVNAMWIDPVTSEVCDCVGGLDDLARGVIRTVGVPRERFSEDYLRMLRAVRFAARFGFELEPATMRAIGALASETGKLAGERVGAELTQMISGADPARALCLLRDTGLLAVLLPEISALSGVTQPPDYHPEGDVFDHTLLMLRHMVHRDLRLAWSVLLHDVGKFATRSVDADGRIRFFSHETVGVDVAASILERFRFSNADRDSILAAIRNHMRFASVCDMRSAKIRKLLADPNFATELELHRLDCISCHAMMDGFVYLLDRLNEYSETPVLPSPWVTGQDLIALGAKPGPRFKEVLEAVFDAQLAGTVHSPEEARRLASVILGN